jgi:hypothetical protein
VTRGNDGVDRTPDAGGGAGSVSSGLSVSGDFVTREILGETLLVPVRGGVGQLESIFTLNETGSTIWSGLVEGLDEAALSARLSERFEVSPERAREDVAAFVRSLTEEGLLVPVGAKGS